MKTLFVLASVMVVIFLVVPNNVEAQKKKPAKIKTAIPVGTKCVVTVTTDLVPKRTFVVVGCDYFEIERVIMSPDGLAESMSGPYGGIVVLDSDLQVVFTWKSSLAYPLSPCQFAGMKKFKGHNALMVKLFASNCSDATGRVSQITVPLYFDGKKFRLGEARVTAIRV